MSNLNPAVAAGVVAAIARVAENKALPIQPDQGPVVARAVLANLEADPIVINETNSEPWYQSRVTWGSIVAVAAPVAGLLLKTQVDAETQRQIVEVLSLAGAAIGGALALWGRWSKAKAPLGGKA